MPGYTDHLAGRRAVAHCQRHRDLESPDKHGEEDTVALGMRFQEMSPKARGMLLGFANSLEKFEEITKN